MSSSRLPVAIAIVLGLAGVGAIATGVVMLATVPPVEVTTTDDVTPIAPTTTRVAATTVAPQVTETTPIATWVDLVDDSGVLAVSVPASWSDVETAPWNRDGVEIGPSVSAATDRAAWIAGWDTPGLFVGATDQFALEDAFGDFSDACRLASTTAISADGFPGTGEWWTGCGAEGSDFFVGVVQVLGEPTVVVFQIAAVDGEISELVEGILASFRYQP